MLYFFVMFFPVLSDEGRENMAYNFVIIGTGLFGYVFSNDAKRQGKLALIAERRNHTSGNLYC